MCIYVLIFNLSKKKKKGGGGYVTLRAGLGPDPRLKMLWQSGTSSSASFQRGICCDIGLIVQKLDRFFKELFPKRVVFVLTNRRHVFELELVETGWLLRQNVIDARLAASKGR